MSFRDDMYACHVKTSVVLKIVFYCIHFVSGDIYIYFIGIELLHYNIIHVNYGNNVWLTFQ